MLDDKRQAGIEITDEMIDAAICRLHEFVIGEDLESEWVPEIIAAALEVRPRDEGSSEFH